MRHVGDQHHGWGGYSGARSIAFFSHNGAQSNGNSKAQRDDKTYDRFTQGRTEGILNKSDFHVEGQDVHSPQGIKQ